ncbi:zinc-binding alcohol dehydrogenase family protein [Oleiagrimonas citrea]|uniref:Zinc-type alcohol dehydrogenase-like protein n=1 Tax=Oleiagrimonas citrea TaxID=1665687 RepID=A0A846ZMZ5_9GAMM|nr:zinc-binding alcohol dehydrogenase family protein [Oleiagrimonas citrea]NKZ39067.1 zinc-binding alcohol dehydrogenase family protein [Oleiagrimonas citrea]
MKAIGYRQPLPIDHADALIDLELPAPEPGARDLLVEVHAVSVNPVDVKVRAKSAPGEGQDARVLGWDVAGVVRETGADVSLFKQGDKVWYAGSIARPGGNSELHAVDERIVGRMPKTLGFAEAAALPLTAITAWELLFDRLGVARDGGEGQSLLIVGAAGGVGSILVQLARTLTRLRVIGTASRAQTRQWVAELGAHDVIDHGRPLSEELARIGVASVGRIASLTHTDAHYPELVKALAPQGQLALIDDPEHLDAMPLKTKSASLHWEMMFARSLFETPDMIEQHHLLNAVSELIESGQLRTTLGEHFGEINARNLRRAHALIERGRAVGKIVLEGFGG